MHAVAESRSIDRDRLVRPDSLDLLEQFGTTVQATREEA